MSVNLESTAATVGRWAGSSNQHCCIRSTSRESTASTLDPGGTRGRNGGVSPLRTRPTTSAPWIHHIRDVKATPGKHSRGPFWGENFWIVFKIAHSGVLYIFDRRQAPPQTSRGRGNSPPYPPSQRAWTLSMLSSDCFLSNHQFIIVVIITISEKFKVA